MLIRVSEHPRGSANRLYDVKVMHNARFRGTIQLLNGGVYPDNLPIGRYWAGCPAFDLAVELRKAAVTERPGTQGKVRGACGRWRLAHMPSSGGARSDLMMR
ncbi:MAG: hypothetical protein WBE26_20395 [Phycisphaerae bacterium]